MRKLIVCWSLLGAFVITGCQKSKDSAPSATTPIVKVERILARVHFKGFQELSTGTNATTLREVWQLAETGELRSQALDKLAPALASILSGMPASTNDDNAALVRPLLDDVLQSESILEVIDRTNRPPAWALAIRLDSQRSTVWQENAKKLIANRDPSNSTILASMTATNSWFLLGSDSVTIGSATQIDTPLWRSAAELPLQSMGTHWCRANVDWPRLTNTVPLLAAVPLPRFDIMIFGKGEGLRTEANFHLAEPMHSELEPWHLPTNTIRDPLISFTVLRGIGGWLGKQEWFRSMGLDAVPQQAVAWGQADTPFQIQVAVPVSNATNAFERLTANWVPQVNSNLLTSPVDVLSVHTNLLQISGQMMVLRPFIRRAPEPTGEFLNGGIFPVAPTTNAPPPELFEQLNKPNLLYYDWEITEHRLKQLRETLELLGILLTLPPMDEKSLAHRWIQAASPKLGNTITEITTTSATELSLVRRSHIGLNGLELIALANWIESTNFPNTDLSVAFRPPPTSRKAGPSAKPNP
ncbi:MAG: hypothetical protein EXS31_10975 [Pedosphaera sp.]|nr:hypothetical protein [Pedosphaera sp.]